MADLSLEVVANRLAILEQKFAELMKHRASKDWRRTVGMFEGSEFMAQVDADILAAREAEREAARAGRLE